MFCCVHRKNMVAHEPTTWFWRFVCATPQGQARPYVYEEKIGKDPILHSPVFGGCQCALCPAANVFFSSVLYPGGASCAQQLGFMSKSKVLCVSRFQQIEKVAFVVKIMGRLKACRNKVGFLIQGLGYGDCGLRFASIPSGPSHVFSVLGVGFCNTCASRLASEFILAMALHIFCYEFCLGLQHEVGIWLLPVTDRGGCQWEVSITPYIYISLRNLFLPPPPPQLAAPAERNERKKRERPEQTSSCDRNPKPPRGVKKSTVRGTWASGMANKRNERERERTKGGGLNSGVWFAGFFHNVMEHT